MLEPLIYKVEIGIHGEKNKYIQTFPLENLTNRPLGRQRYRCGDIIKMAVRK
jgi:hypothetical protein